MPFNIHRHPGSRPAAPALARTLAGALGAVAVALAVPFSEGAAQRDSAAPLPGRASSCPEASGRLSAAGWRAWRAGSVAEAERRFDEAAALCPANQDAAAGLGFLALRQDDLARADSLFRAVVSRDTRNGDGWEGLARSAWRRGDRRSAREAGLRAIALDSTRVEVRRLLDAIDPDWNRPARTVPRRRTGAIELVARTRGAGFEVRLPRDSAWRPFYMKGVNLGVALPGRYPSEFPLDSALYAGWLDTLSAMRANTLRVYTILPPAFYRALRGWNLANPGRELWLVHGVWTELPPGDDFDAAAWKGGFRDEMRRVVDLVHGAIDIPPRPGHAAGRYDADVSPWTLAYIIGREWEPYAVKAFDARHPERRPWRGRFLESDPAPAMDRWMAEQCDYMLAYEFDRHGALRPIAYTNWPTLDPLVHPTEANTDEEMAWRRRSGRQADAPKLEYENDAIGLDAMLVRATAANPAGWFASYHAYPYYPDFLLHDPEYNRTRSSEGRSNYFGYLAGLVRHHAGMPVVIAEYGVPSSRGIAHLQPQGWHHGGHDERGMAEIDARLTREIREAGAAGGIVFAWLDEWFKKNWIVMDFEIPLDHTRRWHNVMDAEQNYGILGQYAGDDATRPVLGGDAGVWRALPAIGRAERGGRQALRAGADASYVYLALEAPDLSWRTHAIEIGIDTWRPEVGQHHLPGSGVTSAAGFEFLLDLRGLDTAALRVLPEYNRYAPLADPAAGDDRGRFHRRPVTVVNRSDGRFDSLFVVTNRARFGRDGTFFPALGYDRGRLRHAAESASTLADWYHDAGAGLIEIRIPWDLLNVTDPSTRRILFEREGTGDFGTVTAGDFRFMVVTYEKRGASVVSTIPPSAWRWEPWDEPRAHGRLKPVYDALRRTWEGMP
jgi:tetratricopeptide (TPR) repeat protein